MENFKRYPSFSKALDDDLVYTQICKQIIKIKQLAIPVDCKISNDCLVVTYDETIQELLNKLAEMAEHRKEQIHKTNEGLWVN